MPINKSNIKPFACRVTRINGTRNKSITSNLARKGLSKHSRCIVGITTIAALALLAIGSNVFASNSVYFAVQANDIVLEVTIPSTVSLPITPTASGAFGSTNLNVLVSTNNINGYTLNMTAQSTDLSRSSELADGTRPTISTLPSSTTQSNFATNRWGWMLSNTNQTGSSYYSDTTYYPMTTDTVMLNYYGPNTPTLTPANGNNTYTVTADPTELTFGVKMDTDVPNGTYGVTLVFEATTNYVPTCEQNKICYKSNGADGGTMGSPTVTEGTTTTLMASNFSRTDHGFIGWNTMPDGTGTYYGPNETVTMPTTGEGLTLYAIWKEKAYDASGNPIYMQNFTTAQCNALTRVTVTGSGANSQLTANTNTTIALEDNRDGNVYAIARLADGKCWMIENLRLSDKKLNGAVATLSAYNTHNPVLPLVQIDGSTTAYHLSGNSDSLPTGYYNISAISTWNTENRAQNVTTASSNIYAYGNYYNWYSATAGQGTTNLKTNNASVEGDICPLNWHLPVGGSVPLSNGIVSGGNSNNNEFYLLTKATLGGIITDAGADTDFSYYSSATGASKIIRSYPNNFVLNGARYSSSWGATSRGLGGAYATATARSQNYIYGFTVNGEVVQVAGTSSYFKDLGLAIRCLAGS